MNLKECLCIFLKKKKVEGLTVDTINHYNVHINLFIKFIGNCDINELTINSYENYILYLQNKKLASRTVKTYASAIRTFFIFCYKEKLLLIDLGHQIVMPRYTKKVIDILSYDDINKIYNYYINLDTFTSYRDLLIISLMLDTGLRLSEVVNLRLCDFNYNTNLIKVKGKGNKERYVLFTLSIMKYLEFYKSVFKIKFGYDLDVSDNLIKTSNGSNSSKNTISLIFKRLKRKLNINVYPHLLRHTFATLFLINGGNIENLRILLGHTTLYMTQHYLHLANSILLANQCQYSPLTHEFLKK